MANEQWQKVREVFDSALSRQPKERRKYIVEVCGVDKTLLAEVRSLLNMPKRRATSGLPI